MPEIILNIFECVFFYFQFALCPFSHFVWHALHCMSHTRVLGCVCCVFLTLITVWIQQVVWTLNFKLWVCEFWLELWCAPSERRAQISSQVCHPVSKPWQQHLAASFRCKKVPLTQLFVLSLNPTAHLPPFNHPQSPFSIWPLTSDPQHGVHPQLQPHRPERLRPFHPQAHRGERPRWEGHHRPRSVQHAHQHVLTGRHNGRHRRPVAGQRPRRVRNLGPRWVKLCGALWVDRPRSRILSHLLQTCRAENNTLPCCWCKQAELKSHHPHKLSLVPLQLKQRVETKTSPQRERENISCGRSQSCTWQEGGAQCILTSHWQGWLTFTAFRVFF